MPVHCEKRGDRYRLIEPSGGIAKTPQGNPRDGGGHESEQRCQAQARVINANLSKAVSLNES